ncbi:MAG: glycosyltransferase [Bacteroidota bacterium]|nr:glycosyltransferase [Bacteroidota bacterium]
MWWLIVPVLIYSAGLFILWLILIRRKSISFSGGKGFPKVSVVVSVRNEEKRIPFLLASLAKQDYPSDLFEVIIVNDNSTDRTPVAVSEFIAGISDPSAPRIKLIYNPFSGKKRAVRYGIEKASGEVILTTDADCTVGVEWVRRHASWYVSDGADMVLAPVVQKPAGGFWSHFGVFEFSALQAITEATAVAGHPAMCNAANMSFRRDVYLRHADKLRSDLPSGDDMFLLAAVMREGGAIRHDGSGAAAAETAAAVTAAALLRQRARWASKAFRLRSASTLTLAAATAACNAAVAAAAVASLVWTKFIPLAAAMYAIKTVPDYLLISTEMRKRGTKMAAGIFLLSEIIYPFYFVMVGVMSRLPGAGQFRGR